MGAGGWILLKKLDPCHPYLNQVKGCWILLLPTVHHLSCLLCVFTRFTCKNVEVRSWKSYIFKLYIEIKLCYCNLIKIQSWFWNPLLNVNYRCLHKYCRSMFGISINWRCRLSHCWHECRRVSETLEMKFHYTH